MNYDDNFERRTNIRFHINCSVRHRLNHEEIWHQGFTDNIAYSGILIISNRRYLEKDTIELNIDFPGIEHPLIAFQTSVMWVLKVQDFNEISYLTGLEFYNITPEQDAFVTSLLSQCNEILKN